MALDAFIELGQQILQADPEQRYGPGVWTRVLQPGFMPLNHSLAAAVADGTLTEVAAAAGMGLPEIVSLIERGHGSAQLRVQFRSSQSGDASATMSVGDFATWSATDCSMIAMGKRFSSCDVLTVTAEPIRYVSSKRKTE